MIVTTFSEDGLYKTNVSDSGFYIRKVGTDEVYSEAVDLAYQEWTYEETDELIEKNGEEVQ